MGYSTHAIRGLSWVAGLRFATRVLSFGRIAVIARILSPSQFGLFGIASLLLALVEVFTETGVNIFLVQEKDKIDKYINSAWIVSIARGFIIGIIILLSAPFVSSFFDAKEALGLLILISLVPVIRGFINPSIVVFQKELIFKKEFSFKTIVLLVDVAVTVFLTFLLRSPYALVIGLIVSAATEVALSFLMAYPRAHFSFSKHYITKIVHGGKWVTMSTIFNYLYQNVDDMVVSKILNTTSLGLYQVAYKISMVPITEVADVIARVTFPVFSKISGDSARLKKAFLKTSGATVLFSLPIIILFFLFPREIILIGLGDNWIGAVGVFQVLVFFGFIRAVTSPALILLLSLKRQDVVAWLSFFTLLILVLTIIPFVNNFGIFGAGLSSVLASAVMLPFTYILAFRYLKSK